MYQELDKAISIIIRYYKEQEIANSSRKSVSKGCGDFREYLVESQFPYSPAITTRWLSAQQNSPYITHSRQRACALIDAVIKTGAVPACQSEGGTKEPAICGNSERIPEGKRKGRES